MVHRDQSTSQRKQTASAHDRLRVDDARMVACLIALQNRAQAIGRRLTNQCPEAAKFNAFDYLPLVSRKSCIRAGRAHRENGGPPALFALLKPLQ
jgi:hypothetical protein